MFYDLNIPWPGPAKAGDAPSKKSKKSNAQTTSTAPTEEGPVDPLAKLSSDEQLRLSELTYELKSLGYGTIAYTQTMYSKFEPTAQNPFRPYKQRPNPPFPKLDPRTRGPSCGDASAPLVQLSRLNIILDKDSAIKSGTGFVSANSHALQQYDLLSVTPLTEAAFQHACITLSELKPFSIDIISLDLAAAPRLPFHLKRSTISAALANGVVFEITYGSAVDPGNAVNDAGEARDVSTLRRNLFSGARDLLRVTNGKGVIFSSSARTALGLRAPYDVMNLATLIGMTPAAAKDTLSASCRSLLIRARTYSKKH